MRDLLKKSDILVHPSVWIEIIYCYYLLIMYSNNLVEPNIFVNKVKNLKLPIPSFALLTSQQAAGYYGNFQDGSFFIPI